MASNKDTTLMTKNNAGQYVALYPKTSIDQVVSWNIGEIMGPFTITLKVSDWERNKQTVELIGVSPDDIVNCVKVLSGTKEEMLKQKNAYNKLKPTGGLQSLNNKVQFTAKETPDVDFKVQVWWTK